MRSRACWVRSARRPPSWPTGAARPPGLPHWADVVPQRDNQLFGSDDFPPAAKQQAADDLTAAARDQGLSVAVGDQLPLEQATEAHERVGAGARRRVLLAVS